jgi:outer membrane murein-binding lipoprotein Lpp
MATDKKHIAVYLTPEIEQALVAFCEQKGLISKKGTMYSAGVNAALSAFFGIADIDNVLQSSSNTSNIGSTILNDSISNIPTASIDVEVLLGKPDSLSDGEIDSLRQELEVSQAENQRLQTDLGNSEYNYSTLVIIGKQLDKQVEDLRSQLETLKAENEALRNAQPVANFKLPDPGDLLDQLKAKRKKATASFADIKAILEILEGV